ncbi:hypothetical protein CTZ27_30085 [Streptomyces griseocarneus]|nr:hypothetical protein CTZ27_30085 [Streptomyces griseocarneus]
MPSPSTRLYAQRLAEQLQPLPADMKGNDGRELGRYAFVTRTLRTLSTGGTVTGERAEDWRRVTTQLARLWQMANPARLTDFRMSVAGLELISREAETQEPAPADGPVGKGPHGGELVFPWHAMPGDWIAVPDGPAGPFEETSMALPDHQGIAQTLVILDQRHRYRPGGPPEAVALIDNGVRVERLDATAEHVRACEQWVEDREAWRTREQ